MKTSKLNRGLSFLLALIMLVGMLPLLPTQNVSAEAYPRLTNLVEGTEITYGYVYFFYKNGKVDQRSVSLNRRSAGITRIYSNTIVALQIFSGSCPTITASFRIGRVPRMIFWIFRGLREGL